MNILEKSTFQAYTQLTLVANFKKHLETEEPFGNESASDMKNKINFKEFQKAIQDNIVLNRDLKRETSDFHKNILETRFIHGGNSLHERTVSKMIDKAFHLGIVDHNERLIAKYKESI
ncbi:hypothetical protein J6TS2_51160 [Heyndrickxia sporothermodurans]|nr:hypothetical protein J6TS2_51160 [Heyndrickxia sporothermodurans]